MVDFQFIPQTVTAQSLGIDYTLRSDVTGFTRISGSQFSVPDTADNQAIFQEGLPLRYRQTVGSGAWQYGIIRTYAAGTITVQGIPLPSPIGELYVGPDSKRETVTLNVNGTLTVDNDLLLNSTPKTEFRWDLPYNFLVAMRAFVETAANGADLHIGLGVGATGNDALNSPTYLNLAQSTNPVESDVNIKETNYQVDFREKLFLKCLQIGSVTAGDNLTVLLTFAKP